MKEDQRKLMEEKKKSYEESLQNSTYNQSDKAARMATLKQVYNSNN